MSLTKEQILATVEPRTAGICLFRNSWSSAWGVNGDGYFDISYLPNVTEIGTAIKSVSTKQKLVTLYTQLVGVLTSLVSALKGR